MGAHYKQVQIIINPAAGGNEPILNTINDVFKDTGIAWDVSITHAQGDARRLTQEAVAAGADLVAAYGGDGTVMEVANGLVGSGTPMAILPGGTGNAMAASLQIPGRLADALALVSDETSRVQAVDLGQVGERYFLLRANINKEGAFGEDVSREMKDRYGVLAYVMAGIQALSDVQPAHYRLTLDGDVVETDGIACLVNNAGSVGRLNLSLGGKIDPTDGRLDVMIVNTGLSTLVSLVASALELDGLASALQHWQVHEVTVEVDTPQQVRGDGELFGDTPVTIQVAPHALDILTPGAE